MPDETPVQFEDDKPVVSHPALGRDATEAQLALNSAGAPRLLLCLLPSAFCRARLGRACCLEADGSLAPNHAGFSSVPQLLTAFRVLSGGQQSRVKLAVLLRRPGPIVLDGIEFGVQA